MLLSFTILALRSSTWKGESPGFTWLAAEFGKRIDIQRGTQLQKYFHRDTFLWILPLISRGPLYSYIVDVSMREKDLVTFTLFNVVIIHFLHKSCSINMIYSSRFCMPDTCMEETWCFNVLHLCWYLNTHSRAAWDPQLIIKPLVTRTYVGIKLLHHKINVSLISIKSNRVYNNLTCCWKRRYCIVVTAWLPSHSSAIKLKIN